MEILELERKKNQHTELEEADDLRRLQDDYDKESKNKEAQDEVLDGIRYKKLEMDKNYLQLEKDL